MKCPICDMQLTDDVLRCSRCNSPLTIWKNLNIFAADAYAAGLQRLAQHDASAALEMLTRCITFAPDEPLYLDAYGRVLARCGRYAEAVIVLKKAHRLNRAPETKAAWERAAASASAVPAEAEAESETTACARPPLALGSLAFAEGSDEQNSPNWQLCFTIEQRWSEFAPFAELLQWTDTAGNGYQQPWAYLQGVAAYAAGDNEQARSYFTQALDASCAFANPDVYLICLDETAACRETIDLLASKGRTPQQTARVLQLALPAVTERDQDPQRLSQYCQIAAEYPGMDAAAVEQFRSQRMRLLVTLEQWQAALEEARILCQLAPANSEYEQVAAECAQHLDDQLEERPTEQPADRAARHNAAQDAPPAVEDTSRNNGQQHSH